MCGICGICSSNIDSGLLDKMCSVLMHRGPDDSGIFIDKNIGLGMRRLSIIDLKTGHQPIHNEDESLWVVFNGEIYNFKELREELEKKGHRFYTNTDTEVIVHSYEEYGKDCVKKFNGMFAFAIWDKNKKLLFLARDRLGIKPLYYYFSKDKFIFGSEIKSIISDATVPRQVDPIALHHYMGYEYIPAPLTIFKDINKLNPGHILVYKNNKVIIEKYWDITPNINLTTQNSHQEKIYHLLKDSIKKRLISDVPLGVFLSGGIDSSYIVALSSELNEEPIKTFSIGFEEDSYNELEYAQKVAKLFNTDHHEKILKPDIIEIIKKISYFYDEPFADSSSISTFLISEMTKKYVTVALSGDGGDELFAGYERYIASKIDRYYRLIPSIIRRNLIYKTLSKIRPQSQKKGLINISKRFVEGSSFPVEGKHMRWQYFLNNGEKGHLYTQHINSEIMKINSFDLIENYYNQFKTRDTLAREQYVDIKTYLSDAMLVKIDRASMANSLEVRVPYLDHRFVELTFTIPDSLKLKGFKTKYILKKAASKLLPKTIIERKKQGFSIPIKNWLRDEIKDYAINTLSSKNLDNFFNRYYINKLIEQHMSKKYDHSHKLWALMNFQLWYENYGQVNPEEIMPISPT